MKTNDRPPKDPSYEPNRLYNLFGKPALGTGMAIVLGILVAACLVIVGVGELVV